MTDATRDDGCLAPLVFFLLAFHIIFLLFIFLLLLPLFSFLMLTILRPLIILVLSVIILDCFLSMGDGRRWKIMIKNS